MYVDIQFVGDLCSPEVLSHDTYMYQYMLSVSLNPVQLGGLSC